MTSWMKSGNLGVIEAATLRPGSLRHGDELFRLGDSKFAAEQLGKERVAQIGKSTRFVKGHSCSLIPRPYDLREYLL